MNRFLEQNIKAIEKTHSEIEINEDIVNRLHEEDSVQRIISYENKMLQSSIDRNKAIQVWNDQFKDIKYNVEVFVFGIGSLDYFVEFADRYPENPLVIFEPCEEIFYNNLACDDYVELLSKEDVIICVGEKNSEKLYYASGNLLNYDSMGVPYYCCIPNYIKLFREEYKEFEEIVLKAFNTGHIGYNTDVMLEEAQATNYIGNLNHIIEEAGIDELRKSFLRIDNAADYPAIIISAGPSLDKNIKDIRDVKGKAFILCVDSALNTVTKNGIRPDIVIAIDPRKGEDFFREDQGRDIPLILQMTGPTKFTRINKGRKFFAVSIDNYLNDILKEYDKRLLTVHTGGAVSTSAYSVLQILGFKTIILMGQDLGFPDNKVHARNTFKEEADVDSDITNRDNSYHYVKSVDGGQVLTNEVMDEYRMWFERMTEIDQERNIVDATEGGALIKGTEVLTIKEAIDKYCPDERVDFEYYINTSEYLLNDEERIDVKEIIYKTFEDIDKNIEYLGEVKRTYYKLQDVNEKRKYNTAEFKRLIKKVADYNKYLDSDKDLVLYQIYCRKTHYDCMIALRDVYEDEYDDIKNIVEQGLKLIDGYIDAAKKIKKKWNEINESID